LRKDELSNYADFSIKNFFEIIEILKQRAVKNGSD
jgi:hypothetical protein